MKLLRALLFVLLLASTFATAQSVNGQPTYVSGGQGKVIDTGEMVYNCGAKGVSPGANVDNSVALQGCLQAASSQHVCAFLPSGTYNYATTLNAYDSATVFGGHNGACVVGVGGLCNNSSSGPQTPSSCLQYTGTGTAVEFGDNSIYTYHARWDNIGVKCNNASGCTLAMDGRKLNSSQFYDVSIQYGTSNATYGSAYTFVTDWNITGSSEVIIDKPFISYSTTGFAINNSSNIYLSGVDIYEVTNCFQFSGGDTSVHIFNSPNIESCDKVLSFDADESSKAYDQVSFNNNTVIFDPQGAYNPTHNLLVSATTTGTNGLLESVDIFNNNVAWSTPPANAVVASLSGSGATYGVLNVHDNTITGITGALCSTTSDAKMFCNSDKNFGLPTTTNPGAYEFGNLLGFGQATAAWKVDTSGNMTPNAATTQSIGSGTLPVLINGSPAVGCGALIYCLYDEFVGGLTTTGNIGALGWSAVTIGATGTIAADASSTPHFGIIKLSSNATTQNEGSTLALLTAGTNAPLPNIGVVDGWTFTWIAKLGQTTTTRFRVGAEVTPGNIVSAGMYARFDTYCGDAATSGTCVTNTNTAIVCASGVCTVTTSGTHKLAFVGGGMTFASTVCANRNLNSGTFLVQGFADTTHYTINSPGADETCGTPGTSTEVGDTDFILENLTTAGTSDHFIDTGVPGDTSWHKFVFASTTNGTVTLTIDANSPVSLANVPSSSGMVPFMAAITDAATTTIFADVDMMLFATPLVR